MFGNHAQTEELDFASLFLIQGESLFEELGLLRVQIQSPALFLVEVIGTREALVFVISSEAIERVRREFQPMILATALPLAILRPFQLRQGQLFLFNLLVLRVVMGLLNGRFSGTNLQRTIGVLYRFRLC